MHKKFVEHTLLLATNNQYKIDEIKNYFAGAGIKHLTFFTPADFGISSPKETEDTFVGNAQLKAIYYGKLTGMTALADDTGICINALDGFPGVHTADWINEHGDPAKLIAKVEEDVRNHPDKGAKAICALSIYWPNDGHIENFIGETEGTLNFSHRDIDGIGFTRIFVPDGFQKPYALMTFKERQIVSHRSKAFSKLHKACF